MTEACWVESNNQRSCSYGTVGCVIKHPDPFIPEKKKKEAK